MKSQVAEYAESLLRRAFNKLNESKGYLESANYPESVSASQECLELSVKAIFLLLEGDFPKTHEFEDKDFEELLKAIPEDLTYLEIHKLYFYSRLWGTFYTLMKYGKEKWGLGPEKFVGREEAKLAYKHAERAYTAATVVKGKVLFS